MRLKHEDAVGLVYLRYATGLFQSTWKERALVVKLVLPLNNEKRNFHPAQLNYQKLVGFHLRETCQVAKAIMRKSLN